MRRWAAVAGWAVLIIVAFGWGYLDRESTPLDQVAPLHAGIRLLTWQMIPAVIVAAAGVAILPRLTGKLRWPWLLLAGWLGAAVWAVALAISDGVSPGITRPIANTREYLAAVPAVGNDPIGFLSTFARRLPEFPLHVKGHPPLPVLALWALDAVGLGGAGWAAGFLIAAGTSATVAIALTVKTLTDEETARSILPFLILAPMAVWIATSMDAFFLAVGAWGTWLTARAAARDGLVIAVAAGLLLGTLPYLSYGLLPFGAVPFAVLVLLRARALHYVAVVAGAIATAAVITAAGFWWPDGVAATHEAYAAGRGSNTRPYLYFLFADFAVLALMTGPAVARALPALRGARAWLAGAALLGMVALAVSGFTKGEVERIWLPYAAWLLVAADRPARGWLAAQATTALVVQALTWSPW